ncbi:MAG: LacI family DNA-binding transcriptional regulator [Propionibacteriaceae bacterium]|jgi:DNA-binding LacI/PurR family transcriptional regulator|nr:LacI family DNA-binding transcriptional regulator [Propionibacteriaceae bacterium]
METVMGSGERRATLRSVADAVGVSRTTVSNAYNCPERVSPGLLEQILDAATRLGYSGPDPLARKLRTGVKSSVGVVFTDALPYAFKDEAAAGFLQGVALAVEQAQTSMLLIPAGPESDGGPEQIAMSTVDSLVVYGVPEGAPYMREILAKRVPVVIVDGATDVPGVDVVGLDQVSASALTARHLAALGHLEVGVLCHRLSDQVYVGHVDGARLTRATYTVQRERVLGFAQEFQRVTGGRGVVRIAERVVSDLDSGISGASAILRDFPDVTAIACTCDMLALGVLYAAQQLGLSVPDDLSVTGFDDIPSALPAGLTTIWQPLQDKGRVAGEMVLGHASERGGRKQLLPTKLQIRGTTGPVAAAKRR